MWTRGALFAAFGEWIPNAVEDDEHDADAVFVSHRQEFVHAMDEAFGVLFPGEVVEENADAGEAEALGVAEFAVDGLGVPGFGLPHFQLVDGGAGDEVGADEPGLFGVPFIGMVLGPSGAGMLRMVRGGRAAEQESEDDEL